MTHDRPRDRRPPAARPSPVRQASPRQGVRSQAVPRGAAPVRPTGNGKGPRAGPALAGIRITPIRIVLTVALVGTLAFIAYTINVREAEQIPMLASGAAVLGIVFVGVAVGGAVESYRSGQSGDGRRAILLALSGGLAAMIAAGCFAGALVLALVWSA